jgi:hypothetical protein
MTNFLFVFVPFHGSDYTMMLINEAKLHLVKPRKLYPSFVTARLLFSPQGLKTPKNDRAHGFLLRYFVPDTVKLGAGVPTYSSL